MARRHIPALDGVRGVAILAVLLFHAMSWGRVDGAADRAFAGIVGFGWSGVDLFFVLSGFLITGILLDTKPAPHYFRNFYARRVLRIFPVYYLFVAAVLVAAHRLATVEAATFISDQGWYWTYTSNLLIARDGYAGGALHTGHLWSLAIEEQFYLVWPLVVSAASRATLQRVVIAAIVLAPLARGAALLAGMDELAIYVLTPFRLDALAMGALLAIAVRAPGGTARLRWFLRRLAPVAVAAIAAIVVATGGFASQDRAVEAFGFSALIALAALLLVESLDEHGPVARAMSRGWLGWFGRISYAMYVVHFPIVMILKRAVFHSALPVVAGTAIPGRLAFAACVLVASSLVALASHYLVERGFLRLKDRFG